MLKTNANRKIKQLNYLTRRQGILQKKFITTCLALKTLVCVLQCRQEYKIPGLYVIDSIVRQSRHQFGPDKEVFGPRFAKNIVVTFQQLYKCTLDEKVRYLYTLVFA